MWYFYVLQILKSHVVWVLLIFSKTFGILSAD